MRKLQITILRYYIFRVVPLTRHDKRSFSSCDVSSARFAFVGNLVERFIAIGVSDGPAGDICIYECDSTVE